MTILLAIGFKSLLLAAGALGMLFLFRRRSAAERSWIAHIGLLALILLALAPLVLPPWTVQAPAFVASGIDSGISAAVPAVDTGGPAVAPARANATHAVAPIVGYHSTLAPAEAAAVLYAIPAAALLLITMLALLRLFALRARAEVLVDGHWLSALARAQRRMGFKHGTALLTSDDLASPISWGLMRPVILLNSRAVEATGEAEAILAHELAHVARMDWAKLLLARIATALFWFNPLVWMLAREAHQLREEAADDAVLGANIVDTDYAQLLVGVARHDCPGLLLGAHGVAPSKSSLARRVARVLDTASARRPASAVFAMGVAGGAVLVAAPLAALTTQAAAASTNGLPAPPTTLIHASALARDEQAPADLVHLIAQGVATSVTAVQTLAPSRAAAVESAIADRDGNSNDAALLRSSEGGVIVSANGRTVLRSPEGVIVARANANGNDAVAISSADGRALASADAASRRQVEQLIDMKTLGVTPEYMTAMRRASAGLANVTVEDMVGLRTIGVTPEYVRALTEAGLPNLDVDELEEARSVGLSPEFVRAVRASGIRATLRDMIDLRSMRVSPEDLRRAPPALRPDPDDPDGG
jgi:bla regulator protein BlaR1